MDACTDNPGSHRESAPVLTATILHSMKPSRRSFARTTVAAALMASLALPIAAQGPVSPRGHENSEGNSYTSAFGAYPESRHQYIDGEIRGQQPEHTVGAVMGRMVEKL